MPLKRLAMWFVIASLMLLAGCWTGAPKSKIPGTYEFENQGYKTTLIIRKDGTYLQTLKKPDGSVQTAAGNWSYYDEDHLYFPSVLNLMPRDGVYLPERTFYTPEIGIEWGRVCLLVSGNQDLSMCKT